MITQWIKIRNDQTILLLLFSCFVMLPNVNGECETKCGMESLVSSQEDPAGCLITMPDNPCTLVTGATAPCQVEIHTNCSSYCHIELSFSKFDLPECGLNVSDVTDTCDYVDSCEYVLLQELGTDPNGANSTAVTHFHGNHTNQTYVSRTQKILLQFCYRSETFSGRNMQLLYRAFNPYVKEPYNPGPVSVYILVLLVVLFAAAIAMIRWNKTVGRCLDPPPEGSKRQCAAA